MRKTLAAVAIAMACAPAYASSPMQCTSGTQKVLFAEPTNASLTNFRIHNDHITNSFFLIQWQPNPYTSTLGSPVYQDVTATWNIGVLTGFASPVGQVVTPGNGSLTAAGHVYTLTSQDIMMEDGDFVPGGAGTSKVELYKNTVYAQDDSSGQWYTWDGQYFSPANAPSSASSTGSFQQSMQNYSPTTGVQIDGAQWGVWLDSNDFNGQSAQFEQDYTQYKLGIMPEYKFSTPPTPFTGSNSLLMSVQLEIPVASNGNGQGMSYTGLTILLKDSVSGKQISYGGKIFTDTEKNAVEAIKVDPGTGNTEVNTVVGFTTDVYGTPIVGSSAYTGTPWTNGLRTFSLGITPANFKAALAKLQSLGFSQNPANYSVQQIHINNEVNYQNGEATLGITGKNMQLSTCVLQ